MKLGNNKPKILITGHTRGIGKAIFDLFHKNGFACKGVSKSTGYDIENDIDRIVDMIKGFGYVVLNAYKNDSQTIMLKKIIEKYQNFNKKIAVITSTSGTPIGEDENFTDSRYVEYCLHKKNLIDCISNAQQELLMKPLSVFDICPDVVDTDMTEGLWEEWPKLKADEVAEAVRYCFESKFNINKIVLQKNAS